MLTNHVQRRSADNERGRPSVPSVRRACFPLGEWQRLSPSLRNRQAPTVRLFSSSKNGAQ
jgi:hypothetical protein